MQTLIPFLLMSLTVGAYLLSRRLSLKFNHPLLNVILLSVSIVIATLLFCGIPYAQYAPSGKIIVLLLGPATVALAVPMYRNRLLLRRYFAPILAGTLSGSFISMLTVGVIARMGGLNQELVVSLVPKSVTLPFAIDISRLYGGNPALTVPFTVLTGMLGGIVGPLILSRSGVKDPASRGLALGTVSHGIGVASALLENEEAGSMAGLAMILAGIITTLLAPLLIPLLTQ